MIEKIIVPLKQISIFNYYIILSLVELIFWYKIVCLFIGLSIVFLGYMLFIKGIFNESGDVEGAFKDYKLIISKAAPGTYFVLFGSIIIGMIIFKGFTTEEISRIKAPYTIKQDTLKQEIQKKDTSIKFK